MPEGYVVISGDYSDKQVEAVFTDKEQAELFTMLFVNARIEVFTLNPDNPYLDACRNGYLFWSVEINRAGDLKACWQVDADDRLFLSVEKPGDYYIYNFGDEEVMVMKLLAKDRDHAAKIANEKRGQLLASGGWKAA